MSMLTFIRLFIAGFCLLYAYMNFQSPFYLSSFTFFFLALFLIPTTNRFLMKVTGLNLSPLSKILISIILFYLATSYFENFGNESAETLHKRVYGEKNN